MRLFTFITILFCGLLLPVRGESAVWTDTLGRSVEIEGPPQRIVSLVPAVTEILYALSVEERIVGVTSFCNHPPQARTKPKIGEYASPNLETLAIMRPDLVVMAADMSSPELLNRLESLGITSFVVYPRSVAETAELVRILGALLDRRDAAQKLASSIDRAVACAKQLTGGRTPVRVLCTVMSEPLVVAGRHTLLDDLVTLAGGENVVPDGFNRYPTWGIESVLAADPDLILVSPHPGQTDPSAYYRRWPELSAVRNERLVTIEADWIQRPGPRLVLGLTAMVKALHGVDITVEGGQCPE